MWDHMSGMWDSALCHQSHPHALPLSPPCLRTRHTSAMWDPPPDFTVTWAVPAEHVHMSGGGSGVHLRAGGEGNDVQVRARSSGCDGRAQAEVVMAKRERAAVCRDGGRVLLWRNAHSQWRWQCAGPCVTCGGGIRATMVAECMDPTCHASEIGSKPLGNKKYMVLIVE